MKKFLIPLFLFVILSLSKDLKAQTLPPIAHTNDPHVLTDRRVQFKEFMLPPRSFSPSMPSQVPTNLRDGALVYDQTQRVYVRWDSVAHAFVKAESDSSFMDPNVIQGSGTSRLDPFTFRDTIKKNNWVFNNSDSAHPGLTIIHDGAQPGILLTGSGLSDGRAVIWYTSAKDTPFYEHGLYPGGSDFYGLRNVRGATPPHIDWVWTVDTKNNDFTTFYKGLGFKGLTDTTGATKILVLGPTGNVHTQTISGGSTTNPLTNAWGINTFSYDGSASGVQVSADTSSGKLATQYYASKVVGSDGIVTGLVTTTSGTTATTTAGAYRLNNTIVTKGSSTNTTIPAQDATLNRYTLIVGDASGAFTAVNGTLAADAVEPDIPANKALIASVYIPATGGTVTTGGGGSGKGTVTKVTSTTADILVANSTTTPALTLNKVNGVPITYYDPTSSIQGQLNGKQAALGFTPYNATNPSNYISLSAISATSPIFYNSSTGVINSQAATSGQNGYLTSTDWSAFNGKLSNVLTTTGDIIYSSSGSTAARLAIGGTNTVLHGGTTPSYSAIVNGDITNSTIDLTTKVNGILPVANGGAGTPVSGEVPSGVMDGSNVTFTAAHTPISGSFSAVYNGLTLQPTVDYTRSGTTVTLVLTGHLSGAPVSTDYLLFNYQY